MSKYQFIVIVASAERKQIIESQFKELDVSNEQIHYLDASVVANSQEYFSPTDRFTSHQLKCLCCARSHLRAIELALCDNSPEFSVILEDDVAMHKTKFISTIEEIIDKWREICSLVSARMVSIGWIPCNNYLHYANPPKTTQPSHSVELPSLPNARFFHNYGPGMQGYVVSKSDIPSALVQLTRHTNTTFDNFAKQFELCINESANNYDICNYDAKNYDNCATDVWLNRMLAAVRMHPMLAIEQPVASLLDHDNVTTYWKKYFENYEHIQKEYMTF
jgi:GR25 family glycosyltransferase involved in LPS biosynthesis